MAGFSYPFDDGPGSTISEDQWSYLTRDAIGTGVHENGHDAGQFGSDLKVFSVAEPGILHINAGRASISGFHYQQSGAEVVTVTANASGTQDRIDAVVLRLDLTTNSVALVAKLGALSTTPVPPAIDATELLLATYRVRKNSSAVLANEVLDRRTFVGRRVRVSDDPGIAGDLTYSPSLERWVGTLPTSTSPLAYQADLAAHVAATDPHPQYLTAAEGNATGVNGPISIGATFSSFANGSFCRAIYLPGGYTIVNLQFYGNFAGVTTVNPTTLFTINDTTMRPSGTFRFVAHQWLFGNSTDDIPLQITVGPTGTVATSGVTDLMGGANVLFNGVYFRGAGL